MKLSIKFSGLMLAFIIIIGVIMYLIITLIGQLSKNISLQQNKQTPTMVTVLSFQMDIIQIQQWLTDISATRAMPGYDDGFDEAKNFYDSAKLNIESLKTLGVDPALLSSITTNLDDYYTMGIEMATAYINEGTDAGNTYMGQFDPYSEKMQNSVSTLLSEAQSDFDQGNKTILTQINGLYQNATLTLIATIIACIFLFVAIRLLIIKRINQLNKTLEDISRGDGDLTKRVTIRSRDEIGASALYFNTFADSVLKIVTLVKSLSDKIALSTEELSYDVQCSASAAEQAVSNIENIAVCASAQAQSTLEGSRKLTALGQHIQENDKNITTLTEISGSINALIDRGMESVSVLSEDSKISSNAVKRIYDSIIKTNDSVESISKASKLINSIAMQTNILSLNASIEAARAGSYGNGFAIVAEEVKKLAEQSKNSTKIIDEIINKLKLDSSEAVGTILSVEKTFSELVENMDFTENMYKEIAVNIKTSGGSIEKLNHASKQMEQNKNEVIDMINSLSSVAHDNASISKEASSLLQEQSSSIERISATSTDISAMFLELNSLIDKFKV